MATSLQNGQCRATVAARGLGTPNRSTPRLSKRERRRHLRTRDISSPCALTKWIPDPRSPRRSFEEARQYIFTVVPSPVLSRS